MTLAALGMGLQIGGKLYAGYTQYKSAMSQADQLESQGVLAYRESLRDAAIIKIEGEKFAQRQSLQYLSSGLELGGSALIIMAQTRKYAATEAESVSTKGKAIKDLAYQNASITRDMGRAALISSITGAAGTFASKGGTTTTGAA